MGFFSKATDDATDATKDIAEDKIGDATEATGMEDNAMVEGVANKATEMSGGSIDNVADNVKGMTGDSNEEATHTCEGGTCSHE